MPRGKHTPLTPLPVEQAPHLLTVVEAARIARCSSWTIGDTIRRQERAYQQGEMPANPLKFVRRGRRVFVRKDDLLRWIEGQVQ